MKKIVIVLTAIGIGMSACKKEAMKTNEKDLETDVLTTTKQLDISPGNPLNPYDSVGYLHNDMMDYIEDHRPADTRDRGLSVTLIQQYCQEQGKPVPPVDFFASVRQTVKASEKNIHELIIAKTSYSEPVKQALDSMVTLLERLGGEDDYKPVKVALVNFEKGTMVQRLSKEERAMILQTASIARHSIFYWMGRPAFPESVTLNAVAKWKPVIRWIAGAISDIGGYIKRLDVAYATECSDYARETVDYCMPDI